MLIDGTWGTVCDVGFDPAEGNVVCRQLGYGSVKTIIRRGGYGRGVGVVHFTDCRLVDILIVRALSSYCSTKIQCL